MSIPIRPTHAVVNLSILADNLHAIQEKVAPAKVMPVVKANAYGHGLVPVGRKMVEAGAAMLGVAVLEEGLALRQGGITAPVLVLGGIAREQIGAYIENDLILTVTSGENLRWIEAAAGTLGKTARAHIKIDTGMGRLGVPYWEAESVLEASLKCQRLRVEGIYSHFATSDEADLTYAHLQLERFKEVLKFYDNRGIPTPTRHMANSGGILQVPESYFDLVRAGIMLYGVYPGKETRRSVTVRPALTWKSQVVLVKEQPPYHPVSYGATWQSDHTTRIVTIPVGYGDGYFRRLSNCGWAILRGKKYPLVGRVCMDQIMLNLEADPAEAGDEVILLGESNGEAIRAEDLAELAGTIPYEILTNIAARVPRIYIDGETPA